MIALRPTTDEVGRRLRVLAVGAHADDIEIGCGGTLLSWIGRGEQLEVTWVVLGAKGSREVEARQSAERFLGGAVEKRVIIHSFKDGYFPYDAGVKDAFEMLKGAVEPDVVFTHYRNDRHQDHRVVSDLTWNTFRAHVILEYEIPKYDGDMGAPNVFVPLSLETCEEKIAALMSFFPSQCDRRWFSRETFLGLARLRGVEAGADSGYAEAFYGRKLCLR